MASWGVFPEPAADPARGSPGILVQLINYPKVCPGNLSAVELLSQMASWGVYREPAVDPEGISPAPGAARNISGRLSWYLVCSGIFKPYGQLGSFPGTGSGS